MKTKTAIAGLMLMSASWATQAAVVGVSISIGEPGFYGQIDLGNYPRPQVIYAEPVVIHRAPNLPPPVYLHVPPGHEKNWKKHCDRYGACGRPVYFVQDSWYNTVYVPAYQKSHGPGYGKDNNPGHGNGNGKGKGKGHD